MAEIPADVLELLSAATRDYVLQLLTERSLVDALAEPRVQALVTSGELVPRARLRVGTELELAPIGLEQAARALVQAAGDVELPELGGFSAALKALTDVLAAIEPVTITTEAAPDETPAAEASHPCIVCHEDVSDEQVWRRSLARFREILCEKDFATYDPKKQKKAS